MQFTLNKKSNYLVLKHKEGREEYEVNILLNNLDVDTIKLKQFFNNINKYPGKVIIVPNMGFVFKEDNLVSEFVYFNGQLVRNSEKLVILTQGHFSLGNLGFYIMGENIDYVYIHTPKLSVGFVSPFIGVEEFKPEQMPENMQSASILLAKESYAQPVLTQDYPYYIFWGDNTVFEQTTGITEYDKKENITIKKVDKNTLTRSIYFLI